MNKGSDIKVIATGSMVGQCKIAINKFKEQGINLTLYNIHTLQNNNNKYLLDILKTSDLIISAEEHSIIGGLGSLISEYIAQNGIKVKFKPMALPNSFGPTGEYNYLLEHHGLTGEQIFLNIKKILEQENLIR